MSIVKVSPRLSDAALARLAQGTKVLTEGGHEKVFQQEFQILPGEKLLKAYACYLSTSTGPVVVDLDKLRTVNPSANRLNPSEKYIHIVTTDGYEFWLMGFISYDKALKTLTEALQHNRDCSGGIVQVQVHGSSANSTLYPNR
ncbi:hypothetical protein Patl1_00741 [Pistacia atlantica]|uniref:Uncharacterized protein n=1 Tax=Pistacia atlantica TaxID=434234 RepID=A0ACC1CAL3_9ROSI|nr:hypothetical protein Patl1_00741 [Pistacia atlantica]